ncbi:MAG TPA: non-ribosomal peptide synthetase [Terriglobales bacterium]|nr:non-ribosomal peptide synthetase [Terriglobales bacterium]
MAPDVLNQLIPSESEASSAKRENQLVVSLITVRSASPEALAVPQLVAARAEELPEALAVATEDAILTYAQLDAQANKLAHYLRDLGVGPGVFTGIYLGRSWQFVLAALAIMKAGGAYVPLDPAYPSERLAYMLQNAQVPVLVTRGPLLTTMPRGTWRTVDLDAEQAHISDFPKEAPFCAHSANNPAYLIYTSGSTGQPKGVPIKHANLSNLMAWHAQAFEVTASDRASQVAGLGFDAAVWEIWPYLTAGASLHIAGEVTRKSPEKLRDWLVAQQITIGFAPTPIAEFLINMEWPAETRLRQLLTGGDVLRSHPRGNLPFAVFNNYGPAECTVVSTSTRVTAEAETNPASLPAIGAPTTNTLVYILDQNQNPVPEGASGEIYIGGAQVADGYLNQPELTAEKFLHNPFSDKWGARLYKTGDLGRWRSDGKIDFLGRADEQVKIRGQRIEPDEIAAWLNRHPAVLSSVVIAREDDPGDKKLVAYLVLDKCLEPSRSGLQEFLSAHLPGYMVPATFVQLQEIPLTANDKINRAGLPAPTEANTIGEKQTPAPAPKTNVEKQVEEIVASLLRLKQVGRNDNFFLLGGHSLLGTQVITRARGAFGVELPLRTIFEFPTIAGLAAQVEKLLGQN